MLFMGEEYGEDSPFLYFVSHTDQDLVEAVRQGRKREFADFMQKENSSIPSVLMRSSNLP
jgi:1,4-alpha-glucan branching enzyme